MSYNPVNWVNGETPINDTNLNNMDKGIADAHEILADHDKKIDDFVKGQIPEEYVKGAVDDYISENQAGLASKEVVEEVAEEVGKLSSEIVDLAKNGSVTVNIPELEHGSISTGTGLNKDDGDPYKYRTVNYSATSYCDKVVSNGMSVYVIYYNLVNGEYALMSAKYITTEGVIDKNYEYMRFVFMTEPATVITENDVISAVKFLNISTNTKEIENIKKDIDRINKKIESEDYEVKDYFSEHIESAVNRINENMQAVGKNGETFIFITDLHWEQNAQNSPALVKYVLDNTEVKQVICGGDLISQGEKKPMMLNMQNCMNAFKFVGDDFKVIFGNHDNNMNTQTDEMYKDRWFSNNECYALMQKRAETVVNYGEYFYFYFDNPTTKTRYICLDTRRGEISTEQFAWLDTILALEDDYNVIIFAHILWRAYTWNDPLSGGEWATWASTLFSKVDTYTDKVKGIFYGHIHADKNDFTDGGIPIICTDTDSIYAYGEYSTTVGTITEQCFDVVTIDYINNSIKCVRIGRGEDREIQ